IVEFGRGVTGLTAFGLAALAAAAALLLGPGAAVLVFIGLAAVWTTGTTVAFRGAVALPWLAPQLAALLALGATIGWRLVVSDKSLAKEIARRRAHEAEMASAAAIQRAMLPAAQPAEIAAARFDVHPFMVPAREVGGDLYDIVRLDAHVPAKWSPVRGQEHAQTKESPRVLLSIGDVCGKGIPAALFMAITQAVMRLAVRLGDDLGAEVTAANRQLSVDNTE